MKKVLALTAMLALVISFQNCSQSSLSGSTEDAVTVTLPLGNSVNSRTGGESVAAVTYIEIPNVADAIAGQQKLSDGEVDSRLVVSLQSGTIQLMDSANSVLQMRCLNSSDLEELKTILAGSKICEKQVAVDDMCAMRMKEGYASLYANEQRVKLGEEFDSCGRGRKDLCGDLATVFQNYISHVKANWADMNCGK